jgi:hypothetical protein
LAIKRQSSRGWLNEATDCIKESCLARTIWTDEADNLIALKIKKDIIECSQSTKFNGEVGDGE